MKKYIYHNKGVMLLEYIIVNLFFVIFLSIFLIFINYISIMKKDINMSIKNDDINDICNKIVISILESKELKINSNIIKTDKIKLMQKDEYLVIYSSGMESSDKLFKIKKFYAIKEDNKLKLIFKINECNIIIRLISLK